MFFCPHFCESSAKYFSTLCCHCWLCLVLSFSNTWASIILLINFAFQEIQKNFENRLFFWVIFTMSTGPKKCEFSYKKISPQKKKQLNEHNSMCSYIWYELSSLPTNFKAADIPLTDQPTKHTSYVSILLFVPTNMWEKANFNWPWPKHLIHHNRGSCWKKSLTCPQIQVGAAEP